jgi:hypothetical protein
MDGMNDNRNTGAPGGKTPENPGLAAVGVNEVRFMFAENFFELFQRAKILKRMDWADKIWNNRQ